MVPLAGYCLPLLVPRWITSGQIGGRPRGPAIFIEVTHHCGPSQCNEGKNRWPAVMACLDIETLGFHGAFYAFLHIWFISCSELMAGLLLSFRMLNIYCHNVILNFCKISSSPLFCETSESWSIDPLQNLWYITSSWRYTVSKYIALWPCTGVACIGVEIPHTKAIHCFWVYTAVVFNSPFY